MSRVSIGNLTLILIELQVTATCMLLYHNVVEFLHHFIVIIIIIIVVIIIICNSSLCSGLVVWHSG